VTLATCEAFRAPGGGRSGGRPPREIPPLITARSGHGCCCMPDGKLVVGGGVGDAGECIDSVEMLDLSRSGDDVYWTQLASLPSSRRGHSPRTRRRMRDHVHLFVRSDGCLIAASMRFLLPNFAVECSVCTYDFDSNVWHPQHTASVELGAGWTARQVLPSMAAEGGGVAACMLSNDSLVLACGADAAIEVTLEPDTDAACTTHKRLLPRMCSGQRLACRIATVIDGRVVVVGGKKLPTKAHPNGELLASAEVYDVGALGWAPVSPLPSPRLHFGICSLPDGRLLIAGGRDRGVDGADGKDVGDAAALRLPSRRWSVITHRIQVRALVAD
jgi:hypothetical protein